jgi:23S rRNA pseudouridine2604 synthase
MPGVLRLRFFLTKTFSISNDEAERLIADGRVLVDGKIIPGSVKLEYWEEIAVDGKIIRPAVQFTYLKCYKPKGIECTLNTAIPDHLFTIFPFIEKLHPVGRLDKESEGLLLMTDDGRVFQRLAKSESEKEKEYLVTVDKPITDDFLLAMRSGVMIKGQMTKRAEVFRIEEDTCSFRIILKQGINRQIRRMCYKLAYQVTRLYRIRIAHIEIENLQSGESKNLSKEEIDLIFQEEMN